MPLPDEGGITRCSECGQEQTVAPPVAAADLSRPLTTPGQRHVQEGADPEAARLKRLRAQADSDPHTPRYHRRDAPVRLEPFTFRLVPDQDTIDRLLAALREEWRRWQAHRPKAETPPAPAGEPGRRRQRGKRSGSITREADARASAEHGVHYLTLRLLDLLRQRGEAQRARAALFTAAEQLQDAGFLAFGLIFFVPAQRRHAEASRSARWPTAKGEIISSEIVKTWSAGSSSTGTGGRQSASSPGRWTSQPRILYRYAVAGRTYQGHRIRIDDRQEPASAVVARYPVGRVVDVHFDLAAPSRCALEKGGKGLPPSRYFVGLGALALAALTFIVLLYAIRRSVYD